MRNGPSVAPVSKGRERQRYGRQVQSRQLTHLSRPQLRTKYEARLCLSKQVRAKGDSPNALRSGHLSLTPSKGSNVTPTGRNIPGTRQRHRRSPPTKRVLRTKENAKVNHFLRTASYPTSPKSQRTKARYHFHPCFPP